VCALEVIGTPSRLRLTRKAAQPWRVFRTLLPTLDLSCEENAARRKWKSPLVGCASSTPEAAKTVSVYYETRKRKLNRRLIYECRCDERLKVKAVESTHLGYTGLCGGLEHLKIETRLIDERFASVMGECVFLTSQVRRQYSK
jgi:hypothetical protein